MGLMQTQNLEKLFFSPINIPLAIQLSIGLFGEEQAICFLDEKQENLIEKDSYLAFELIKARFPEDYEKIFFDNFQQEICNHCEEFILEKCSNSSTFQCEGSYCDLAFDYFVEYIKS